MTVYFILLTVSCFFVNSNSAQNIYPDNGWRPTSIEKVLELQRDFIKKSDVPFKNSPKQPTVIDDFEDKNFVKIIQTNEISKRPIEDDQIVPVTESNEEDRNEYLELVKVIQPPHKEMITLEDTTRFLNHEKQNQQLRKPKMIEDSNIVFQLNNALIDQRKSNEKKEKTDEQNLEIDSTTTYEIKENTERDILSTSDKKLYTKEFKHVIPKSAGVNTRNNLTANLLDILANYNIRTSDNLQNYDKSLRQNSRNSHNNDITFVHIPLKIPVRYYNNANHLPVDPLLAVFLSNYGYYLPSLFGFHGGYKNLYGYLASNNIHNNKPFGSYKIFSDTDSFH